MSTSIPSAQHPSVVAVVGAGYVGLTAAACFAALGHRVRCVEQDADRLATLLRGDLPIYEPGLAAVVADGIASGGLTFTADMDEAISGAPVAFLCVGTPPRADGRPDLRPLAAAGRSVARAAAADVVLVIKSTVPPGTCEAIELVAAETATPGVRIDVVSNPEFLREGQAVSDFFSPDRVVVGADHAPAGAAVSALYPQAWPMLRCDRRSAELVKYASNTFLALKISFANEIAGLCERLGADAVSVLSGVGMDQRIGRSFLAPGAGFGGSCLTKDVSGLVATGESLGCPTPIARAALDVNTWARHRLVDRLETLVGSLRGRKVAVLGVAFKPGTDDVRDSPAVTIIERLTQRGATVATYDPVAKVAGLERLQRDDAYAAMAGADAVVVATGWPEFARLDPARVAAAMAGTVVLDAAGVLDADAAGAFGLEVITPGRASADTLCPAMVPPLEWALDAAIA